MKKPEKKFLKFLNQNGFSLVELLVVISIIGLLSSFAVVSLNSARTKARDAVRKGDMNGLRTALNLYYDDNLEYPICAGGDEDARAACYIGTLATELTSGTRPYMGSIPKDPKNPNNLRSDDPLFYYGYDGDGSTYVVYYRLEDGDNQTMEGW